MAISKKSKRQILIASATSITLALSLIGFNVFNNHFNKDSIRPTPDRVDPSYGVVDSEGNTFNDREEHTAGTEVGIITDAEESVSSEQATRPTRPNENYESNFGENNDFEHQPGGNQGANNETETETETEYETESEIITEATTEDVVELLSTLTGWFKEYLKNANSLSDAPDLTVLGVDSMEIDSIYNAFQVKGTLKAGNKIRTFTAEVLNVNSTLALYNLEADGLTAEELNSAIDEVSKSADTTLNLKLGQFIAIANKNEVIKSILTSRYNDVSKINSASTKAEATYLNGVLKNIDSCSIRVSAPSKIEYEDGFRYSFNTYINTGKFTYYTTHYFETQSELNSDELQAYIDQYLKAGVLETTTYVTSNSVVNQFIHEISERAEEKTEESTFSK